MLKAPKEPYGSHGRLDAHPHRRDAGFLAGGDIRVGGVHFGDASHLDTQLVKSGEGGDKAGEVTADSECGDAVISHALGNALNVVIPNDLAKVDEVVVSILAASVGPEHGTVDAVISQVPGFLGNGFFKKVNVFMMVSSVFYVFSLSVV